MGDKVTAVRVVERKKNFTRLKDGTILLPDTVETLLEAVPGVRHVCVISMVSLNGYSVIVNTAASTNVDEKVLQQEVQRASWKVKLHRSLFRKKSSSTPRNGVPAAFFGSRAC